MSYRFKLGEPLQKGMRRILLSQIETAGRLLGEPGDQAVAIHESRKSFKRIRALLRLVRHGIGEKVFARENAAFRDIAAQLASARDRHVLLQTALKLQEHDSPKPSGSSPAEHLVKMLQQQEPGGAEAAEDAVARIASAREALSAARKRMHRLRLEPNGFEPIERGLRLTHKRAIAAMQEAFASGSDEDFHEWRKGVQQHWRHMRLLSPAWPEYFEARVATAKLLAQRLGEDHDLSMLAMYAEDRARSGLTLAQSREIITACRALQTSLRRQAAADGKRLYADRPRDLGRHIAALWKSACETAEADRMPDARAKSRSRPGRARATAD